MKKIRSYEDLIEDIKKEIENFYPEEFSAEIKNYQRHGFDSDTVSLAVSEAVDDERFSSRQAILVYEATLDEKLDSFKKFLKQYKDVDDLLDSENYDLDDPEPRIWRLLESFELENVLPDGRPLIEIIQEMFN